MNPDETVLSQMEGSSFDVPLPSARAGGFPHRTERNRAGRRAGAKPTLSPLVGRREELTRLLRDLRRALAGGGSVWSITGAAGVGKTRLMEELARLAQRLGFEVRWGLSTWEGQTPLFPFLQLLRARPKAIALPLRPGWSVASPPELWKADHNSTDKGRRGRTADYVALDVLDALREAAQAAPQLLLIDDFHRSDPDSIRFLALLARQLSRRPVLVVISLREEFPLFREAVPPELTGRLTELQVAGLLQSIELPGLGEEELMRLAKLVLHHALPRARWSSGSLVAAVRAAGGNPFFLRELTSLLVEARGELGEQRKPGPSPAETEGLSAGSGLPRSMQELLRRRLNGLPRDHGQALVAAALVGETFGGDDVARALPTNGTTVPEVLDRMATLGWPIRRSGTSGDMYAFQHALLRQASLELVPRSVRREFAGRLATSWTRWHPDDLETVARLYAESDRPGGGLRAVDRLIEEALRSRAFGSLDRYLDWRTRIVGPSAPARRRHIAEVYGILERLRPHAPTDLRVLCERFLRLHPPEPQRSIVEAWHIGCLLNEGEDLARASERLDRLGERAATDEEGLLRPVKPHIGVCELRLAIGRGELKSALTAARRLSQRLARVGPSFELLIASEVAAFCLCRLGRFPEMMTWVRRSRGIARRGGWTETSAGLVLLDYEAAAQNSMGHFARAARVQATLARKCASQGSFARSATGWSNRAAALINLGDFAGARDSIGAALQLARRWGLSAAEGWCYSSLGQCLLLEGNSDAASRYFRRALPLVLGAPGTWPAELMTRVGLARCHIAKDELNAADAQLRIVEGQGPQNLLPAADEVVRTRSLWLERNGNRREARRLLRRSLEEGPRGRSPADRLETLAALARLERRDGNLRAAQRLETRLQTDRARSGADASPAHESQSALHDSEFGGARSSVASVPKTEAMETDGSGGGARRMIRTLWHLGAISGSVLDREEVPPTFTQAGLARELGVPRGSFARTLLRLVARREVVQLPRAIQGGARVQKAYFLTARGVELASASQRA